MRKYVVFVALLAALCFRAYPSHEPSPDRADENKVGEASHPVPLADPFILLDGDTYYAYGTGSDYGIPVYTSKDLEHWTARGLALNRSDVWADRWFWAPEVYKVNGRYYMYYSADEHVCVATADSPFGPFRQQERKPMIEEKGIDNSLFIDRDGTPYMFYVRFNDGNAVWVVQLEDDLTTVKPETMRPCIHVSQKWEEVWPRVNEGPFVVYHQGLYYMMYSANSYESQFYGMGCATATSVKGPWTKYAENPLLQNPGSLVGVGHGALFTDKDGNLRTVYHAHRDKKHIHPRDMYIGRASFVKVNGTDCLRLSADYIVPQLEK